ncbi:hypothetical protein CCACVL1_09390 [Corchorus capsularis]|uniref:Uncharacterized protein n=1 Tax=Corchorus capsularis TaxID=210143 RepID=A0A1R3IWK2_COCAP|nr:hypothetical protein CCACVL1_09390 [Corchorus capsularis]
MTKNSGNNPITKKKYEIVTKEKVIVFIICLVPDEKEKEKVVVETAA